jgi:hypothetical protein
MTSPTIKRWASLIDFVVGVLVLIGLCGLLTLALAL